jgi:hypothetical protein
MVHPSSICDPAGTMAAPTGRREQIERVASRYRQERSQLPDAEGYNLKPDPIQASTAAELTRMLNQYRRWNGWPSLRKMAKACGQDVSHAGCSRQLPCTVRRSRRS